MYVRTGVDGMHATMFRPCSFHHFEVLVSAAGITKSSDVSL